MDENALRPGTNLLVTIRFVGTAYHGSQIQSNAHTVQAEFQTALCAAFGSLPDIKCCSRTDAGVHANMFCINFASPANISPEGMVLALNRWFPPDIRAIACRAVPPDFHARYSSCGKRYIYKIWNHDIMDPFWAARAMHFLIPIDERSLHKTAQVFIGRHDFTAFCAKRTDVTDHVRTVSHCEVTREGDLVIFSVTADGFLYNMARVMAGTLLSAARENITSEEIAYALKSKERTNRLLTAPAEGLYLDYVFYPDSAFETD